MSLRSKVLSIFKQLHKTRKEVFAGDAAALTAGRERINSDFKQNKDVANSEEIGKLLETAIDVERILRTQVIQGRNHLQDQETFVLDIRKDVEKYDNIPYEEMPDPPKKRRRRKCSDGDDTGK